MLVKQKTGVTRRGGSAFDAGTTNGDSSEATAMQETRTSKAAVSWEGASLDKSWQSEVKGSQGMSRPALPVSLTGHIESWDGRMFDLISSV